MVIALCAAQTPSVGIQFYAIDCFQQGIFARCYFIKVHLQRVNLFVRSLHLQWQRLVEQCEPFAQRILGVRVQGTVQRIYRMVQCKVETDRRVRE